MMVATHTVYQVAPDGTVTRSNMYDSSDADVLGWVAQMRRDNPDHRYQVVRV